MVPPEAQFKISVALRAVRRVIYNLTGLGLFVCGEDEDSERGRDMGSVLCFPLKTKG